MPSLFPARLRILLFILGGAAFAIWLSVFRFDDRRPVTPQERADRLTAAMWLGGQITADTPPSPAHWAQLRVWQDHETGERHPLARDAAALVFALTGGSARAAGIVALALAAGALGLLLGLTRSSGAQTAALVALALLAVTYGRAWQITDPYPYLVLAASAFTLASWIEFRAPTAGPRQGILLGTALVTLFLCGAALGVLGLTCVVFDALVTRFAGTPADRTRAVSRSGCAAVGVMLVFLGMLGSRNLAVTGDVFVSPSQDYNSRYTSAPNWFWEPVRMPQRNLDPVMERYDELVAMVQARFESPVYQTWGKRLTEGAARSTGVLLALGALAAAFFVPAPESRPARLMLVGVALLALLCYPFSSSWWPLLTGPLLWLMACGLARLAPPAPKSFSAARLLLALGIGQLALITSGSQAKPNAAEYAFEARLKDVEKKILETPGPHLVFVALDPALDANVEPADLPLAWRDETILYARDLAPEKNAALAAAMPDRKAWRMVVFSDRIGLQDWSPAPPATAGAKP